MGQLLPPLPTRRRGGAQAVRDERAYLRAQHLLFPRFPVCIEFLRSRNGTCDLQSAASRSGDSPRKVLPKRQNLAYNIDFVPILRPNSPTDPSPAPEVP